LDGELMSYKYGSGGNTDSPYWLPAWFSPANLSPGSPVFSRIGTSTSFPYEFKTTRAIEIVALQIGVGAAVSAGSIGVTVYVDGSPTAATLTLSSGTAQTATISPVIAVASGSLVSVEVSPTADLTGPSRATVLVEVQNA
jgi:hypothetical protein